MSVIRSGFTRPLHYDPFKIDLWGAGGSIDKELALVTDLPLAHQAYEAALRLYPDREITLRQGARVLSTTEGPRLVR